jgi:hypothetical protein
MGKRNRKRQPKNKKASDQNEAVIHTVQPEGYFGLDPMANIKAASYSEGAFLKNTFTGNLRTNNPFWLALMGITGIVTILPTLCAMIELANGFGRQREVITNIDQDGVVFLQINDPPEFPIGILIVFVFIAIFGVALLVNFAFNLRRNLKK